MPTASTVLSYLSVVVLPLAVGGAATWLISNVHILGALGVTHSALAAGLLALSVFAVSAGLTWLTQHHILLGKAAVVTPASIPYA